MKKFIRNVLALSVLLSGFVGVTPANAVTTLTPGSTITVSPSVLYKNEVLTITVNGTAGGATGPIYFLGSPSCMQGTRAGNVIGTFSDANFDSRKILFTDASMPVSSPEVSERKIWLGTACGGTSPNFTAPVSAPSITFSWTVMPQGTMNPATPAAISPATQTVSATKNSAITASANFVATYFSNPATYSVSPTLPAGLSLNTTTGAITGTPTSTQSSSTYTVTGTDGSRSATATIDISVAEASAPSSSPTSSSTPAPTSTGNVTLAKTGGVNTSLPIGLVVAGIISASFSNYLRRRSLVRVSR